MAATPPRARVLLRRRNELRADALAADLREALAFDGDFAAAGSVELRA